MFLCDLDSTVCMVMQLFSFNLLFSSVVQLEMMCVWSERFNTESDTLSSWINEKEKELEAIDTMSSMDPLDKNIIIVEVRHTFFV